MVILNKYEYNPATDVLGKGGFATVYKAHDRVLDIPVALKFFTGTDQNNKYGIISEIRRAIQLSHPNIVKYYGVETLVNRNIHGEDEEIQIGVMELVQEGQMKVFMSKHPLNLQELNKLFVDVLQGLKYLHSEGIIHRDIKPQNILLGRDKQGKLVAKIADFGISKAADSNQASASILLGTVEYMAPEQFNPERYGIGGKVSYNVDVWSFGVTAYYLLTGDLLFGSRQGDTSAAQLISKIISLEGVDEKLAQVPPPFQQLLRLCLVPNANGRSASFDELIGLLLGSATPSGRVMLAQTPAPTQFASGPVQHQNSGPQPAYGGNEETQAIPHLAFGAGEETQAIDLGPAMASATTTGEVTTPARKKSNPVLWVALVAALGAGGYFAYPLVAAKMANAASPGANSDSTKMILASMEENLVAISPGSFTMGTGKEGYANEGPAHKVELHAFKLMNAEVTQAEWTAVMKDGKFASADSASYPATNVSYLEVQQFIKALNKKSNQSFRLPTESEWEFAAVQGRNAEAGSELNAQSWNVNNSGGSLHPVRTTKPNNLGIYDLLGNAYEWCQDWFSPYGQASQAEGRVLRGGDYKNQIELVDVKRRNMENPGKSGPNIGFRLAAD